MERIILHCDLNHFYAAVACAQNPEISDRPVAVCGSVEERHGIVLAKNVPARSFGVKTGEPVHQARKKCPKLVILPPDFSSYVRYSRAVRDIYEQYTDYVEPFGIDECWLDVTGSTRLFGDGASIADRIRGEVRETLGVTVSVGVAANKVLAKMGSDLKKPDATTVVTGEVLRRDIWPMPVRELFGVGWSSAKKLTQMRIDTIGGIAAAPEKLLRGVFGHNGAKLWQFANGIDPAPVAHKDYLAPIKSIGRGITCIRDLNTPQECKTVMLALAQPVGRTLRREGLAAAGVYVGVKDSTHAYSGVQKRLPVPEQDSLAIARAAFELFNAYYAWNRPVRALTVRAISLMPAAMPIQLDLFSDAQTREKRLTVEHTVDRIRSRHGGDAIGPAVLLSETNMPGHARDEDMMTPFNFLAE